MKSTPDFELVFKKVEHKNCWLTKKLDVVGGQEGGRMNTGMHECQELVKGDSESSPKNFVGWRVYIKPFLRVLQTREPVSGTNTVNI
jgi:hypothetical protein